MQIITVAHEYRMGEYYKQFDPDNNTISEVINTYDVDDNGVTGRLQTGCCKHSKKQTKA